jgi:hypothetical protein
MRILFFFLFFFQWLTAWGQAVFVASADTKKVETGYMIAVSYTLENSEARTITPPKFEGFRVHSGPNQSFSTTVVNGKVSQKQVWTYVLVALEPGLREIGPATVETKSGKLQSNALVITVTTASAATGTAQELAAKGLQVFVQSKLTSDTTYVGQSVRVEDVLYAKVPVESFQLLNAPEYKDLFARDLRRTDPRTGQKDIGKYKYATRVLKATALIGQKPGVYAIAPNSYQLGILSDEKPQRDPFGRPLGRSFKPETVRTTGATLTVLPLPDPAPSGFCGLVGNYELQAVADKTTLSTDDAFLISLRILGDGDPKMLTMPSLAVPQGLEAYPPKLVSEEPWEADNQGYFHETVLEYYIVPQAPADYSFTPEIVVFDTESGAYRSVKTAAPIQIKVNKGTGKKVTTADSPKDESLKSPHTRMAFLWLGVFALIGAILWFMVKRKPKTTSRTDWTEELKPKVIPEEQAAVEMVKPSFTESDPPLESFPNAETDPVNFYRSLEKQILQALQCSDRYSAKTLLAARQEPQALRIIEILELGERVQYAGARPAVLQAEVLEELREALKVVVG